MTHGIRPVWYLPITQTLYWQPLLLFFLLSFFFQKYIKSSSKGWTNILKYSLLFPMGLAIGWLLLVLVAKTSLPEKEIYAVGQLKTNKLTALGFRSIHNRTVQKDDSIANWLGLTCLLLISKTTFLWARRKQISGQVLHKATWTMWTDSSKAREHFQMETPDNRSPTKKKKRTHSCFFLLDLFDPPPPLFFSLRQWNHSS